MTIAVRSDHTQEPQPLVIDGVSWETYEHLLEDVESSGQHIRITYDMGRMTVVSPLPKHEKWKSLLGRFVEAIADERDIPISTFGSTTWKHHDKLKGLEADECFYIQHESQVRGKLEFALAQGDPPPDLAIEVDVRPSGVDRRDVYATLGVNEIWEFDGEKITAIVLSQGRYVASEFSAALPFLRPSDLKQFLDLFGTTDQNSIIRAVREWTRKLE